MRKSFLGVMAALALLAAPPAVWPAETPDTALGLVEGPLQLPSLRTHTAAPGPAAQPLFGQRNQVPLFRGDLGGSMDQALRPAYRAVEGAADGLYDFLRVHVIRPIMPGDLSRSLAPSPETDSYAVFRRDLSAKEDRLARQMLDSYPAGLTGNGYYTPAQLLQWQSWAREQQVSVFIDSFRDSMLERHQLERFGRQSGDYAKDTGHWDPGFLAMSAIVGGTFLYLNGLHATAHVGDLRIGVDLRAAMRVRSAAASRGDPYRLGGIELGWKDKPLTLAAYWGMQDGRLAADQIGLNYHLRY